MCYRKGLKVAPILTEARRAHRRSRAARSTHHPRGHASTATQPQQGLRPHRIPPVGELHRRARGACPPTACAPSFKNRRGTRTAPAASGSARTGASRHASTSLSPTAPANARLPALPRAAPGQPPPGITDHGERAADALGRNRAGLGGNREGGPPGPAHGPDGRLLEELISRNVAQIVPAPQVEPRELCPWSMDESLTFLEAARSDSLYPAFVLAVALGLRRGEILGLHWRDVGLDRRTLTVRTTLNRGGKELYLDSTKNRRARVVPLPIMCVAPLRWQRMRQAAQRAALGAEWHDSGLVFTTRSGLSIEPRNLYRSFQRGVSVSGSAAGPSARHPARVRIPAVRGWRRAPHRHGDPGALSDCGHHERLHARQR